MKFRILCGAVCLAAVALSSGVRAQGAIVVPACGSAEYAAGNQPLTQDQTGTLCTTTGGGGGGNSVTPVAPDVSTVTTGGTAVTAFNAGHVAKGGYIQNPTAATAALCVSLVGAATTAGTGSTSCIAAGNAFSIPPMTGAVSVNSTDSAHAFSGAGFE